MPENESVWTKKPDDLTVGESLKVTGTVMVASMLVSAGIAAVAIGAPAAWEKFKDFRQARKFRKELDSAEV